MKMIPLFSVLDSKPRLSRLPESHQTPHGTEVPIPSCHILGGEKIPCSCGCHWKRGCPEAASSGVKAFGHSWGEYPFKTSERSGFWPRESVLPRQTTSAVNRLLFSLILVCKQEVGRRLCVLVCGACRRQTSVQDKQKLD